MIGWYGVIARSPILHISPWNLVIRLQITFEPSIKVSPFLISINGLENPSANLIIHEPYFWNKNTLFLIILNNFLLSLYLN